MSEKKWYDNEISMGIMTRKYLHEGEKPEEFIPRLASIFSDEIKDDAYTLLDKAWFLPGGRTLFGAGYKGKRKLSTSNCYVLGNIPEDNIESIFNTARDMARIFSYGGGVGISLDTLRPKGARVNNSALESSGAVSFLNVFDTVGQVIGQNGRRAAIMVGLSCEHPDIYEYLRVKQNNEKLSFMNISIKFTDKFMKAVEENRDFELHFDSPETGKISNVINAREFFEEFCECSRRFGDPGLIFIERVRRFHLLSGYPEYTIDVSNPCAEYFGTRGNSCNLGSVNLYEMVDDKFTDHAHINYDRLRYTVHFAVHMLDEVLDYGRDMQPLELNKQVIDDWRSIGLGIFGMADAFVALGIKYGSEESRHLMSDVMDEFMKQALITSIELAKLKGPFKKFDSEKTLKSIQIQAYPELHEDIKKYGIRNGSLLSIAPTGTISLFAGKYTGGIEPMFKIAYERTSHSMEDSGKTFLVYARGVEDLLKFHHCEGISVEEAKKRFPFLIESHEVPYLDRVRLQAIVQEYVDNAISSTVNLPHDATKEQIYEIYMEAWKQGLKGITVFVDGCERGNILGVEKKKDEEDTAEPMVAVPEGYVPAYDSIDAPSRRNTKYVEGATVRERTSCARSMYVTVNKTEDDKVFEVFTNASGGCQSNINTITRLISLSLRSGVKLNRVLDELRNNQCPACQLLRRNGELDVSLSCSNAIADAIEMVMKKQDIGKVPTEEEDTIKRVCPECGKKTLIPEGKCVTCSNCGWSKCE